MKKVLCFVLAVMMILCSAPALAKSKKMDTDLPKWTEKQARQYLLDYIEGKSFDRLYSYFDLQIRRYYPEESFASLLVDLEFMTGKFVRLSDNYNCYETQKEDLAATNNFKVHEFHLVMEKVDLTAYLTTKNDEDDWEVMALTFSPAAREELTDDQMLVDCDPYEAPEKSDKYEVVIGKDPYQLNGILTVPKTATEAKPAPVCVLIHDDGANDMDMTLGETKFFADVAELFGEMGIATLRFDKRTFAYPSYQVETVWDEIIEDALSAISVAAGNSLTDSGNVYLLGLGFGGTLCHRIAYNSKSIDIKGIIVLNGTLTSKLEYDYNHSKSGIDSGSLEEIKDLVRNLKSWKEDKVQKYSGTVFGHTAYYYWDQMQNKQESMIKATKIKTLIVQSRSDPFVDRKEGLNTYKNTLGKSTKYITYLEYRNINHILMKDITVNAAGEPEYSIPMNLDVVAGRDLANWILGIAGK